ncbi:MAG: phenylalanine--tRNA ligase subunit alpha, partial [Pseudomonadota bacterium]
MDAAALEELKARYLGEAAEAATEERLEEIRVAALGKKGEVSLMMRGLGKMSPEERQSAGPALNALKDAIQAALAEKKAALAAAAL